LTYFGLYIEYRQQRESFFNLVLPSWHEAETLDI